MRNRTIQKNLLLLIVNDMDYLISDLMHKYSFFSNQKNEIKKDKNGFDICKKRMNKTIIKKFYSKEYGLDLVLMFSIRIKNRRKSQNSL